MKKLILVALLVISVTTVKGQIYPLDDFWHQIYTLESNGKLKTALAKVDSLRALPAYRDQPDVMAKSYLYHAKFRVLIEEDARLAVFYELDSLIQKEAQPIFIYHLMRAQSMRDYHKYNRYDIQRLGKIEKDTSDFHFWTESQFFRSIEDDFTAAVS